jgi:hypothetical protein
MTITFIIDAIIDEWDESKVVIGETKAQENDEFNEEAIFNDNSTKNNQGVKWPGSEGNFGGNNSDTGNNTTGGGNAGGTGGTGAYGGSNRNKDPKNFIQGGEVNVTRGGKSGGTQKMTVNAAYKVKYDVANNKMYLLDEQGNVIKEAVAYTSKKGCETQKGGAIPKGTYLLNNDYNSHNAGKHTRERNGEKVNENAMTLYGVEGSAGTTLKNNDRAGINLHYGENSNWSEGCAVTPDTSFLKEVSEIVGNSNIVFEVV